MEKQTQHVKRALIYTRVSTDEQAGDERQSLKAQKRICQKALEDMGFVLADNGLYSDPGKSATNMNRPALQDMLIRVREDKSIAAIFVQDTDRLARNVTDHLSIKALLRKDGVELISVSQPSIKDDPEGRMMDLIVAGFNQFQSDITSRKTIKSLEEKFQSGWWPTKAPLGYLNAPDPTDPKKRIIVTDPERAPLVAEMFELYATGDYSIAEVRDIAYRKGLLTIAGKKLASSKMFELIRCHFYYGDMHWYGHIKKGNHEPIIKKEIFEQCQKVLEFNNKYACRRRKYDFLLRGFVFCKTCEQRYTASHIPKKNKSYYYCNRNDGRKCNEKYVEVHDLENQIQEYFNNIKFSEDLIQKITLKVQGLYKKQKSVVSDDKKLVMTKKVNLENKLEVAEEKLISGTINDETYNRIKQRVGEQLSLLEDELYKLDRKKNLKMDTIQVVLGIVRNIGEAYRTATPQLKRLYLGLFWDEFRVANKVVTVAQKAPILLALEAAGSVSFHNANHPLDGDDFAFSRSSVQIDSVLGAYRESNPNREFHKL